MKFFTHLIVFAVLVTLASAGDSTVPSEPTSLTVYAAITRENGPKLSQAFEKYAPGAHISIVTCFTVATCKKSGTGGTGELLARIKQEKASDTVHADVLLLADPTAIPGLVEQQILSTYKPAKASQLPPSFQAAHWSAAFSFNSVIVYQQGMQPPTPRTWQDLLSPIYRDQIELGDPAYSGTTLGTVGYLSETYGWSYFLTLKQIGAKTVPSTQTVGDDVADGTHVKVGISLDSVASKKSSIVIVWPTAIQVPAPVSIVAGHENTLSREFVDWLFSTKGQDVLAQLNYAPALGTYNLMLSETKPAVVDWAQVTKDRISLQEQFYSTFYSGVQKS